MPTPFTNQYKMFFSEEKMRCEEFVRGVVLPRRFEENGPSWGLGGVCKEDGSFVELSAYDGGWTAHGGAYSWDEEEYQDCDAVYIGLLLKHWGHFLVDGIARLWFFACYPERIRRVKAVYLGEDDLTGNYLEFLELLGISLEHVQRITKPTRFRNVIVPQFSCRPCIWYSREYLKIFDAMAERVRAEGYTPKLKMNLEKVYFSRLQFGKAKYSEFGEQILAKWMSANGFSFVQPEQLSLRDQIYIWNHARKIVCLNGSIPINIVFSQNSQLDLVVLNKTKLIHKNLEMYLLMRPCNVAYVDVYSEPIPGYPKSIGAGPFLLYPSKDLRAYSEEMSMYWPYKTIEIAAHYLCDYVRLVWCIANLKGRIRTAALKVLPASVIEKIRRRRDASR